MKKVLSMIIVSIMIFASTSACFAIADPNITIVNPVNETTVTSTNLLISVKIAKKEPIKVSLYKDESSTEIPSWQTVFLGETYISKNDLNFYTRKVENISPGRYRVKVDTLGNDGSVIYSTYSNIKVKGKDSEKGDLFNQNSGATTFLQTLLKSIFGN